MFAESVYVRLCICLCGRIVPVYRISECELRVINVLLKIPQTEHVGSQNTTVDVHLVLLLLLPFPTRIVWLISSTVVVVEKLV